MESGINPAELTFVTGNSVKFAEARMVAECHDAGIKDNSVVLQVWEEFFDWYRREKAK